MNSKANGSIWTSFAAYCSDAWRRSHRIFGVRDPLASPACIDLSNDARHSPSELKAALRGTTASVKVCGCRPHDGGAADTGGRRTQTSKGGNRGRCGGVGRQTLWGFRCWRSVADVRWMPVWNTTDEATSLVGRSRHAESESRSSGRTTRRLSMVARGRA